MIEDTQNDITALTVQLLSAYVSRNTVPSESLADLIKSTRSALTENSAAVTEEPATEKFTPAVSVRKSLASPDHILSLIDGKPYKTLKRHLTVHGLTPEQYRERYSLPKTYPLVAQSYSETRRAVAEKTGLGKKPAIASKADAATAPKAPKMAKPAKTATTAKPVPIVSNRSFRAGAAPAPAKSAAKPKSLKAALEAANTHLSADAGATGTTTVKS